MEVKNHFVRKTCFFLFIILAACVGPKENNSVNKSSNDKNETCFVRQELLSSDEFTFYYENISFEIKQSDTLPISLKINNAEYPLNIDLESPDIKFWHYKCQEKSVLLIEGDDYYGSTFFTYYLTHQELYYLGNLVVLQPNVESEGVFKKDFIISFTDNQFEINSLLKGEVYDTVTFTDMKRIDPI